MQGAAGHEVALLRRQEDVARRLVEEFEQHAEIDGRIFLGRRHQHGAVGDERQAEVGREVPVGPEHHEVELAPVRAEVIEQPGRIRSVLAEPFLLPIGRRAAVEHFVAQVGEDLDAARSRDRETGSRARRSPTAGPAGNAFSQVT